MSCSRVCRELVWLARFGEFGPSSAPHLEHLERCVHCRDEIGFDRALVRQLREALAERIAAEEPSPLAWETIVERTQQPQRAEQSRISAWSTALVGRLRVATAMTGTGLALILAMNMEIVPLPLAPVDAPRAPAVATELLQVPRAPAGRAGAIEQPPPAPARTTVAQDPEALMTLPSARAAALPVTGPATDEPADDAPRVELRVVFRAHQSPEPSAGQAAAGATAAPLPPPVRSEPGRPS
jgi:hypothetical protein